MELHVVHAPATAKHCVTTGLWCGVSEPADELPARADVIVAACRDAGATLVEAEQHERGALLRVHTEPFLHTMETAYARWVADGHLESPGNPYVTPYYFPPVAGIHGGRPDRPAATIRAEIGKYAMDTMTLIGDGTWDGAVAATDAALTAADLVLAGRRAAYAVCRPPGHHAGPTFFGGSCYLNNAAVAAAHLRESGVVRVAVVDIDAHHGNGTQAVFWDDPAVLYASLHVDPAAGWFPHTVGHADEIDRTRTNLNIPVPPGTADAEWLAALRRLCEAVARHRAEALVVSLGVDAATDDPNSPLLISHEGFAMAGRLLDELNVPTVLVHEGGYVLETLGALTVAVLTPFGGQT